MDSSINTQVTPTIPDNSGNLANKEQIPEPPKKHHRKIILFSVITFFILLICIYLFLAFPYQISGDPIPPFQKNQLVFTEKLSYIFTNPRPGDRVIFIFGVSQNNFVGVVTGEKQESGKTFYVVRTPANNRLVPKENIRAKIYYPFLQNNQVLQVVPPLVIPTPIEFRQIITPSPAP